MQDGQLSLTGKSERCSLLADLYFSCCRLFCIQSIRQPCLLLSILVSLLPFYLYTPTDIEYIKGTIILQFYRCKFENLILQHRKLQLHYISQTLLAYRSIMNLLLSVLTSRIITAESCSDNRWSAQPFRFTELVQPIIVLLLIITFIDLSLPEEKVVRNQSTSVRELTERTARLFPLLVRSELSLVATSLKDGIAAKSY